MKFDYRWQTARRICAICNDLADSLKHVPPCIKFMPNLVVLVETVWASVGGPKVFGVLWPRPLNWVRGCPLANSPLLHVGYKLPNFVKRHECNSVLWFSTGKTGSRVLSFKVTQSHRNWHRSKDDPMTSY